MKEKHILILGAGLVSEPLIDYLLEREENFITIASNIISQAETICLKKYEKIKNKDRMKYDHVDVVKNRNKLLSLIKNHCLVISVIPPLFHHYVANACLELNKNLLTTSYISEEIRKMSKSIKDKNLIFMFEAGMNPGLDHIIAYKVIREQEELGNTIIGYESWVGAVPSPECVDNPLLYKFSWSPKQSLLTLRNEARQLINGKVIKIPEKQLLTSYVVDKRFHPSLNLEGYYNRDSLKYKELYNLKDATNVIRGAVRYQGFTFIIQCFKFLGLYSFSKIDEKTNIWRDHLNKILKNPRNQDIIYDMKNKYLKKGLELFIYNLNISDSFAEKIFYFNLAILALSYFEEKYIRKYGFDILFNRIYSVLIYLEFYKEDNIVNKYLIIH